MEEIKKIVKVKCFRYNPEKDKEPYYQEYEVPLNGEMNVQNCLIYIRENIDPSLAFIANCRFGFCRRCLMKVNGKACLACTTVVKDDIVVEPLLKEKVIRDLWIEGI